MAAWYVRTGGADTNGGSSASLTPDRSGTDMSVTNGNTQVTSATGAFVAGDVGKGICIATVLYKIATVTDGTTIQLDRTYAGATGGGKAWAIGGARSTIAGLAASAATVVADGDTIWVGAGTYRLSAAIAPTTHAAMTYLYGDTDGSKTGDAGEVIVTNYATDDTTAPAAVRCFQFTAKNFWTLGKLTIIAGSTQSCVWIETTSHDLTFQDLTLWALGAGYCIVTTTVTFGTVQNILVERCRAVSASGNALQFEEPTSASGSDVNAAVLVRNSLLMGGNVGINVQPLGTAAKHTGGITIANCAIVGGGVTGVGCPTVYGSTTNPVAVYNNLIAVRLLGLNAGVAGVIVSDYNVIAASTPLTNVTQGANDIINGSRMWRFSLGHETSYGGMTRPFGMLPAGSPLLGWGTSGAVTVTDDINGVTRPASGAGTVSKAIGPFERSNSGTRETTVMHGATNSLKITGPGYHDFDLPVDAVTTNVHMWVRWDGTYAGTKPSIGVVNGGECGVANATATATGSANTWEELVLTFTPTAKGIVTIRLLSSDTNGAGIAYFGDRSVV